MDVGYVGLGAMGGALAQRLQQSRQLRVYDMKPEAVSALVADGAVATQGPAQLAAASDLVLLCLPTSNEVREAVFGPGGVAEGLREGGVIADMTTGDPIATRKMAAELVTRGIAMIDAPVSGGPQGALAGTIAIMVGAPPETFERVAPVLRQISPNLFHAGGVGAGHTMKLVNNVISSGIRQITFEAVAMGIKNGLSLETCIAVLQKGSGRSFAAEVTLPRLADGAGKAHFTLALNLKDVRLATELGQQSGAPMHLAAVMRENLVAAINELGAGSDIHDLIRVYERSAAVSITRDKEK